jgi:hypothetical protein
MSSLKNLIREAQDLKWEDVEIPEWGDIKIRVKAVKAGVWEGYERKLHRIQMKQGSDTLELKPENQRAALLVHALFDPETDLRIFTDTPADIKLLAGKSAGVINGLYVLCQKLSDREKEFGQKVEEAEEDFDDGQS